jgi:hypothetical protein
MPDADKHSGWTIETLLVHFTAQLEATNKLNDQHFALQQKAVEAALAAAKEAVAAALVAQKNISDLAAEYLRAWQTSANEWRGAMTDREKSFAPIQRLEALEKRMDMREGDSLGKKAMWGYVAAAGGIVTGAVGLLAVLWSMFGKR